MSDDLLLGVDVGTTNIKAIVFTPAGAPVGAASVPTPVIRPRPAWAEHDPEVLWQATAGAIRAALSHVGRAERVRGVAVASVGEAGVLLDARGRPTGPMLAWFDERAAPQHRAWAARADPLDAYVVAGVNPAPIYGTFKLMWLRDEAPAAYAAATTWLHVADYIAFRLSGARATDYSLATRSMLLDLQARRWSDALVERAGLRRDLLPELVASGERIGSVTDEAAAATGLAPGTAVGAGGHDHVCGALAAGVSRDGDCLDSMGTAEPVFMPLDALRLDADAYRAGLTFGAHVARGRFYVMTGMWSGGGAVNWLRRLLAPDEPPERAFGRVEALAAQAPPGSLGVLFLPQLSAGQRGAFVGLSADAGPAELARAVYEGLAYEWRRLLETTEGELGVRGEHIRVIGGGARSPIWLQIKADVLSRPLRVLDLEEGVALGAAQLGGLAAGVYRDEADAAAQLRLGERPVDPVAERAAQYERIYRAAFMRLAPAVRPLHAALEEL